MMILAWYYTYHQTSLASGTLLRRRFKSWLTVQDQFITSYGSGGAWKS